MSRLTEMLAQEFMRHVLAGTALVGALCGFLGVFIVLRRQVFVGAALAQISSLGVALSYFVCGWLGVWLGREIHAPPQPTALALTLAASALFALQYHERRLPRETLIGTAYVAASGLAILVVATSAHAHSEVLNLLFGNVLTISGGAVIGLAGLAAVIGGVHWFGHRQFLFASFDPDTATAFGVRAPAWNLGLLLTVGLTISLAINAAGALVVFGLLVLPPATALLLARNLRGVFAWSTGLGLLASLAGVSVSYLCDLPTGPTIVGVSAGVLGLGAGYSQSLRLK